jgi:hypothetical protein
VPQLTTEELGTGVAGHLKAALIFNGNLHGLCPHVAEKNGCNSTLLTARHACPDPDLT